MTKDKIAELPEGVEMPEPDTHCWDSDTESDVWSYSKDQLRETVAAAVLRERESISQIHDAQNEMQSEIDDLKAENERLRGALKNSAEALESWRRVCETVTIERDALIAQAEKAEPVAWADDAAIQGRVGNVCSTSAKRYWERSDWVDKKRAELHRHPLYTAPQPAPSTSPLTVKQRVDIADACEEMDFDDDYLGIVSKVIDLTEAAHGIGAKP